MNDRWTANLLAKTYLHRVTARRPDAAGGETLLCMGEPCALSRTAQVSAPKPPDVGAPFPEAAYALTLYTRPERIFRLGDWLDIDDGGRLWLAVAADSIAYPSHAVTVVEIRQVTERVGEG